MNRLINKFKKHPLKMIWITLIGIMFFIDLYFMLVGRSIENEVGRNLLDGAIIILVCYISLDIHKEKDKKP